MENTEKSYYCKCGCKNGVRLKFTKEDEYIDLSLVQDCFYSEQKTSFSRFVEKLKRIWGIIRNKEYSYFEILIENKDFNDFKAFVNNL